MINYFAMEQMMEVKQMEMNRYIKERSNYPQVKKNEERLNLIEKFMKIFSNRRASSEIECCTTN